MLSEHLRHGTRIALLYCLTLLCFGVEARPFVLLSGVESLPDDDTAPSPPAKIGSSPMASVAHPVVPAARMPAVSSKLGIRLIAGSVHRGGRRGFASLSTSSVSSPSRSTVDFIRRSPAEVVCHNARGEVIIESGFQGNTDVFSNGRTAFAWSPMSDAPASSKFTIPAEEHSAAFVVRTGPGALIARPEVLVSDPSILTAQVSEKSHVAGANGPRVFLSEHSCKRIGVATVTIALPLYQDELVAAWSRLCPGTLAPVVFAYQKACDPASHSPAKEFQKALDVKLPERAKLHAFHREEPEKPWAGIIPVGGFRFLLISIVLIALVIVIYECGNYWFSEQVKKSILDMGPVMFGCPCAIDHVSLSITPRSLIYTIKGLQFANPEGVQCQSEYFMNIEEVVVWINIHKLICTCGHTIEIRQLVARHIAANIEVDGYVFGESNISKVMSQMEKNNQQWIADLARIKAEHGIDAAKIWSDFEGWMKKMMERVTLKEVKMEGIGYSMSSKAIGMDIKIADMEFHNFSEQHDARGVQAISYYLTHAVMEGMANDIAGVEFGHHHFEGLLTNIKRWTGSQKELPQNGQAES